ncbi:C-type lectin mannose-binding isoform-like [Zootoca vivipara]|uniref:C-type lectin mannose-binding isoform-like n=1 Tax=Zootoca vivipara TaxID=8524 RepID=UPI00293BE4BF|nr:C-type lectin mannose-binding isoform-like [Zootoca vivipara]
MVARNHEACCKHAPNGHLASLRDAEDLRWLAQHLSALPVQHVWIGLSDRDRDGNWEWSDGSKATFMPWREGEPDDSGVKFCVFLSHQDGFRKFRADRCPYYLSYVCEHKP